MMVITGLVVLLTIINLIGVRESARAGDIFTVSKLIPLLLFVAVGLFFISGANFSLLTRPGLGAFSGAVFVLVYVFSGFEAVLVNSGEVRQSQRVIPFALLFGLGAAVLLFLLIQVVCIGTLPQLASSERPVADASQKFLGTVGPVIISVGALIGILGTLNTVMLALTRLPFAMAVQGQLPRLLMRVHEKYQTPHVSILISAVTVLLLSIAGTFIYAVRITVITRVIVYLSTCLALPILRRRQRSPTGFHLPGGFLISGVCVALCLWLLAYSAFSEVRDVAIALGIGLAVYAVTRINQRRG